LSGAAAFSAFRQGVKWLLANSEHMETSLSIFQSAKIAVLQTTHLSKDALHVYVGLTVMLAVAILLKRSLADWRPLAAVALAAIAGELWDAIDTFNLGARQKWGGNWKHICNTMFWPAIFFGLARFTRILKR
jgi:hypothetical protein